jgi:hypothetical protein
MCSAVSSQLYSNKNDITALCLLYSCRMNTSHHVHEPAPFFSDNMHYSHIFWHYPSCCARNVNYTRSIHTITSPTQPDLLRIQRGDMFRLSKSHPQAFHWLWTSGVLQCSCKCRVTIFRSFEMRTLYYSVLISKLKNEDTIILPAIDSILRLVNCLKS